VDNSGNITGTPTAGGTYNFKVQVTDSASPQEKATANLSIKVVVSMQVLSTNLPAGTLGVPYSTKIDVVGGTLPYKFVLTSYGVNDLPGGALPPGLVLLPDGTVEGTPTGPPGEYAGVIEVYDSGNPQQTNLFIFDWIIE